MKNFIIGIFFGAIILVAAVWYYGGRNRHTDAIRDDLHNAATHTKELVQEKLGPSNMTAESMKDELHRTGQIVREKAQHAGAAIADATANARITAAIKAKLLADTKLASLKISVSTTDGVVTLSGSASSAEHIQHAMELALDTDGVNKVISTLQVKD
jgi:hypothetical protein